MQRDENLTLCQRDASNVWSLHFTRLGLKNAFMIIPD